MQSLRHTYLAVYNQLVKLYLDTIYQLISLLLQFWKTVLPLELVLHHKIFASCKCVIVYSLTIGFLGRAFWKLTAPHFDKRVRVRAGLSPRLRFL